MDSDDKILVDVKKKLTTTSMHETYKMYLKLSMFSADWEMNYMISRSYLSFGIILWP